MIDALKKECLRLMPEQYFDSLGLATIDFNKKEVSSFALREKTIPTDAVNLSFDLASLTKPMTLAVSYFLRPSLFSDGMILLLEHRAGLPPWGRLPQGSWREVVSSYSLRSSSVEYSDISALRLQVEIEKKLDKPLYDLCSPVWHEDVCHWRNNSTKKVYPVTGHRRGRLIAGEVNDDNAFFLGESMAHAGLFASAPALAHTLVNFNEEFDLLKKMKVTLEARPPRERFLYGFDTNRQNLGPGSSPYLFGHLGFTGTSFWIDAWTAMGLVVLSNACYPFCRHRESLNQLRKSLGDIFWCPSRKNGLS